MSYQLPRRAFAGCGALDVEDPLAGRLKATEDELTGRDTSRLPHDDLGLLRARPRRLNTAIAVLFMIGSAGFALGSTGLFAGAVSYTADAATFFVASIFFTAASFLQLVQSQSPAMAPDAGDDGRSAPVHLLAWRPRDMAWWAAVTQFPGTLYFNVTTFAAIGTTTRSVQYDAVVWKPDFYGSILFIVASVFGILAVGRLLAWRPRDAGWRIAWLNMLGSVFFMASAVAAFVVPDATAPVDVQVDDRGTWAGAVCFFVAALLVIPAWTRARREAAATAAAAAGAT